MDQGKTERVFYLDLAKVLALLAIVLGHYGFMLNSYGITGAPDILTKFANCSTMAPAITIFFMASGALLMGRNSEKLNLKTFYLGRIKRVYPMLWIAYGIVFSVYFYLSGGIASDAPRWKIILSVLGIDGYFAYLGNNFYILGEWFLGAIIMFYILFPAFKFLIERIPKIFGLAALGLYIWVQIFNPFQVFLERNLIVCFFACILGMYISKYVKKVGSIIGILVTIISVVLMFVPLEMYYVYVSNILGVALYLSLFWISQFIKWEPVKKVCKKLNSISYSVFLIHHVIIEWLLKRFSYSHLGKFEVIFLTIMLLGIIYIAAQLLGIVYKKISQSLDQIIESMYNRICNIIQYVYLQIIKALHFLEAHLF